MPPDPINTEVLLLSSTEGKHTGRSGYTLIAGYLPGSTLIEVIRSSSPNLWNRVQDAVLSRLALSSWYRKSSFELERKALKAVAPGKLKIVHLLWGDRDIGFLDLYAPRKGFKLCCSIHNCESMLETIFNFPARLKKIDAFILMSKTQKAFLVKHGVPEHKIHVVLHGIDNHYFNPVKKSEQNRSFTVLSVGSWQRDFGLLREVCIRLKDLPGIQINIVSSEQFRHFFADLEHVIFFTGLSNEALLKAYQDADCFLMTAKDSSANNAILEAMACGLPIVTERVGGIPEYVNDECAFICTPKNVAEISLKVKLLSDSLTLRTSMGTASRARALELDWKKSATDLNLIYSRLLRRL